MKTKLCTNCDVEKSVTEFNWKIKHQNILSNACKTCSRAAGKAHYQQNKQDVIGKIIARHKINRDHVYEWKQTLHCVACEEDDHSCLDFHHYSSKKTADIGNLIGNSQLKRLKKELKLCVVLCSNCHRKHHAGRFEINKKHIETSQILFETFTASIHPLASNQ